MATCSRCGQPITWAKTQNGKNLPLDTRPDERYGSFLLIEGVAIHQARASDEEKFLHGYARYQSHFETCPKPDRPARYTSSPS